MFVYVAIFAVLVGLWLFALVDAVRVPAHVWKSTGRDKVSWIIAIVIVWFGAPLVYVSMIRPSLREEQRLNPHRVAPASRPPVDLRGGLLKCKACGFTSNPLEATECRNCGAPI